MANDSAEITMIKNFTIATRLTLTRGILNVGSSKLKLANLLQCAIGDGTAVSSGLRRGEFIFPSEHKTDFNPGNDGIDLFYFGTTDRTVDLFWPSAETKTGGRKVDSKVIRNVIVNPSCKDDVVISLREDDSRYRINGGLEIIAGALDIVGNTLETIGLLNVYPEGDLFDSADDRAITEYDQVRSETLPRVQSRTPAQFYSCFISYSTKDLNFSSKLRDDLKNAGVRVFLADVDMKGGQKIKVQLDEAIENHDKMLTIFSENSIKSSWFITEIKKAIKLELQDGRGRLFPIRLMPLEALKSWELFDADEGRDLAKEVRDYHIPDFSNWQNDEDYDREFEKLLRDLRAEKT